MFAKEEVPALEEVTLNACYRLDIPCSQGLLSDLVATFTKKKMGIGSGAMGQYRKLAQTAKSAAVVSSVNRSSSGFA